MISESTPLRPLCAAFGWFAVLAQYVLNLRADPNTLHATILYLSFFTILSNIAVAAAFTAPLLPPSAARAFLLRPGTRTAIGVYILITAVVFFILLRAIYHPTGFAGLVNALLHDIMPALYLADWAFITPKRTLRFAQLPFWLIFPLAYCAYTIAHGAASGWYPYPFLNVATFGTPRVALNILALTALFIATSSGLLTLGRRLPP